MNPVDHIGLNVRDLSASRDFFVAVLETIGFELVHESEAHQTAGIGADGHAFLWLFGGRAQTTEAHIAFRAPTRASVEAFYEKGLELDATANGAPAVRPYGPTYYSAYLLDTARNNIEAVCFEEA